MASKALESFNDIFSAFVGLVWLAFAALVALAVFVIVAFSPSPTPSQPSPHDPRPPSPPKPPTHRAEAVSPTPGPTPRKPAMQPAPIQHAPSGPKPMDRFTELVTIRPYGGPGRFLNPQTERPAYLFAIPSGTVVAVRGGQMHGAGSEIEQANGTIWLVQSSVPCDDEIRFVVEPKPVAK